VENLHSLAKTALPNVVETVKWGNFTYLLGENNLAWILIYIDHVDYGFLEAQNLIPTLLRGQEKGFGISELMATRV